MGQRAIVAVLGALVAWGALVGCGEKVNSAAYASFRYTDLNGAPIPLQGQPDSSIVEHGLLLRRDKTRLPDGREAIQEIWVVDPVQAAPPEYRLRMTEDGLVSLSGGSFRDYTLTPPQF